MNTHTFGNHSVTCPICQRTGSLKLVKIGNGLFTCPSCQERLVVTWSGHYVRDPFNGKQVMLAHLLRRQSRPWARILRDFGFVKRPSVLIALGSAILFGVSIITLESLNSQQNGFQGLLEQVTEIVDPPEKSP
jgi:ribosomal protein L37AE/L43A